MPRTRKVRLSEQGVDERGHDRALGQHQQAAEQRHHDQDRGEPELLADAQEAPQLGDEFHRSDPPRSVQYWLTMVSGAGSGGSRGIQWLATSGSRRPRMGSY